MVRHTDVTTGDRIEVTTDDDRTFAGTVVDTTTEYITTDGGDGTHKAHVIAFERGDGHRMKVFDHDAASDYDDAVDLYTTRSGVGCGSKAIVANGVDYTVEPRDDDGFAACEDVDLTDVEAGDTVVFKTADGTTRSREAVSVDTDEHGRTTVSFEEPVDVFGDFSTKRSERIDQFDGAISYLEGDIAEPEYDSFAVVGIRVESDSDDAAHADAHDLSEGDTVEVEATPMSGDEPGTITGTVTEATIHTLDGDEVGSTVKIADADGNLLIRNGAGTLSVVDDDYHVTIAWDSTLRRVETDGGDDIIVAGDDGVILSDEDDDREAHPDDEGVEILTDGGTDVDPESFDDIRLTD